MQIAWTFSFLRTPVASAGSRHVERCPGIRQRGSIQDYPRRRRDVAQDSRKLSADTEPGERLGAVDDIATDHGGLRAQVHDGDAVVLRQLQHAAILAEDAGAAGDDEHQLRLAVPAEDIAARTDRCPAGDVQGERPIREEHAAVRPSATVIILPQSRTEGGRGHRFDVGLSPEGSTMTSANQSPLTPSPSGLSIPPRRTALSRTSVDPSAKRTPIPSPAPR